MGGGVVGSVVQLSPSYAKEYILAFVFRLQNRARHTENVRLDKIFDESRSLYK